jgi:uncharacterized protein (TIGR04206 family)
MTTSSRGALVAVVALLAVPWSIQLYESGAVTVLFAWGSVTPGVGSVTTLPDFLVRFTAGLPEWLYAWPIAALLYGLGVLSAAAGVFGGHEDVRLTAGLLALAGVGALWLAWGFSFQPGRIAIPAGTVALWSVVWWFYLPVVRARDRPS